MRRLFCLVSILLLFGTAAAAQAGLSVSSPSPSEGGEMAGRQETCFTVSGGDGSGVTAQFLLRGGQHSSCTDVGFGSRSWKEVTGVGSGDQACVQWDLSPGNTYSWCGVADDGSTTTRAGPWQFTVNMPPRQPSSPTPSDGATGVGTGLELSATVEDADEDQVDYTVYGVSGSAASCAEIAADTNKIGGGTAVTGVETAVAEWNGLSHSTTYSWCVTADDGHATTRSPVWEFTTAKPCSLDTVTVSPQCGGDGCEKGETVSVEGQLSGQCPSISHLQVDMTGSSCTATFTGSDISGVFTQQPSTSSGQVSGTWSVPAVPGTCQGATVAGDAAAVYTGGTPATGNRVTGTTTINGDVTLTAQNTVNGFGRPPTDPDGDGSNEDITGDSTFNPRDVRAFHNHMNDPVIQGNTGSYDFNGDGQISFKDTYQLFIEAEGLALAGFPDRYHATLNMYGKGNNIIDRDAELEAAVDDWVSVSINNDQLLAVAKDYRRSTGKVQCTYDLSGSIDGLSPPVAKPDRGTVRVKESGKHTTITREATFGWTIATECRKTITLTYVEGGTTRGKTTVDLPATSQDVTGITVPRSTSTSRKKQRRCTHTVTGRVDYGDTNPHNDVPTDPNVYGEVWISPPGTHWRTDATVAQVKQGVLRSDITSPCGASRQYRIVANERYYEGSYTVPDSDGATVDLGTTNLYFDGNKLACDVTIKGEVTTNGQPASGDLTVWETVLHKTKTYSTTVNGKFSVSYTDTCGPTVSSNVDRDIVLAEASTGATSRRRISWDWGDTRTFTINQRVQQGRSTAADATCNYVVKGEIDGPYKAGGQVKIDAAQTSVDAGGTFSLSLNNRQCGGTTTLQYTEGGTVITEKTVNLPEDSGNAGRYVLATGDELDGSVTLSSTTYAPGDDVIATVDAARQGTYKLRWSLDGSTVSSTRLTADEQQNGRWTATAVRSFQQPGTVTAALVAPGNWWNPLDSDRLIDTTTATITQQPPAEAAGSTHGAQCRQQMRMAVKAGKGRPCTQQTRELVCPQDSDVTYTARDSCQISFLKQRGWAPTGGQAATNNITVTPAAVSRGGTVTATTTVQDSLDTNKLSITLINPEGTAVQTKSYSDTTTFTVPDDAQPGKWTVALETTANHLVVLTSTDTVDNATLTVTRSLAAWQQLCKTRFGVENVGTATGNVNCIVNHLAPQCVTGTDQDAFHSTLSASQCTSTMEQVCNRYGLGWDAETARCQY